MAITQANRLLRVATPLKQDELLIKSLSAREGISQLFEIELELLHEETDHNGGPYSIDPNDLIGKAIAVDVMQEEDTAQVKRHFHGICISFAQGNRTSRWTKYNAVVVPRVWLLTQIRQSRIFQQKSVADILKTVLTGFDVKWELNEVHEPRNYCVQYRESDWDFASRLMEEEGIFYYFEHTESGHKLIVADTPQSHKPCPTKSKIEFARDRSSVAPTWASSILTWRVDDRVRTGKYTLWDHKFQLPGKHLEASQISRFDIGGNKNLEIYDYPGDYAKRFDGIDSSGGGDAASLNKVFQENARTTKIRQQEMDVSFVNFFGTSDCASLQAGFRFELTNHLFTDFNAQYVVVSCRTEAMQSPIYISDEAVTDPYLVSFVGISYGKPDSPPFRPLRRTPKPIVHGSQTAVVVGPPGEEIFTDKYGRVKVQFHWDRHGQNNDKSSCWLRVAQMWAGKKWGTMFIPRIGMEVLVDFLEGDPDQPIIVGCVYNADNMPPYDLPDNKTRSTIKTNSSKGGGGFNEIRFEDKIGSEQIFIHAQKNQDIRVEKDNMEWIGKDRHLIVQENQYEKVKKDKHLQVTGDQVEKVDGNVHLQVGSNKEQKIGSKFAVDAGQQIHLKAGMSVIIEGGTDVTLKAGGSFVNVGPTGVSIKGAMVMLNSGGAAGSGGGASPGTPKDPTEADKDKAGEVTNVGAPPPPKEPLKFAKLADVIREGHKVTFVRPQPPDLSPIEKAMKGKEEDLKKKAQAAKDQVLKTALAAMAAAEAKAQEMKSAAQQAEESLMANAKAYADEVLDKANEIKDKAQAAKDELEQAFEDAKQAAEQKLAEAEKALADAKAAARDAVNQARDQAVMAKQAAMQVADDMKQQAQQTVDQAKEEFEQAKQQAEEQVAAAQQKVDEAKQEVEQAAQEARQQAEQAVDQAKQEVAEAKEQVEQAAAEAKDQAQQAVEGAKQQAEQAASEAKDAAQEAAAGAQQAAEQVSQGAADLMNGAQDAIPFFGS